MATQLSLVCHRDLGDSHTRRLLFRRGLLPRTSGSFAVGPVVTHTVGARAVGLLNLLLQVKQIRINRRSDIGEIKSGAFVLPIRRKFLPATFAHHHKFLRRGRNHAFVSRKGVTIGAKFFPASLKSDHMLLSPANRNSGHTNFFRQGRSSGIFSRERRSDFFRQGRVSEVLSRERRSSHFDLTLGTSIQPYTQVKRCGGHQHDEEDH